MRPAYVSLAITLAILGTFFALTRTPPAPIRPALAGSDPDALQGHFSAPQPQWIWYPEGDPRKAVPAGARYFRKIINLKYPQETADFEVVADNGFELFVNGRRIGDGNDWKVVNTFDFSSQLVPGVNVIAVKVSHAGVGPAGLMVAGLIRDRESPSEWVISDATWKTSQEAPPGWDQPGFDDRGWVGVRVLGTYGKIQPWGAAPAAAVAGRRFEAAEGFVVERVAGPDLTGSLIRFQFDHLGRPLISREGGSTLFAKVRPDQGNTFILDGRTPAGKYTRSWVYSDKVKDCQGYFDLQGAVYCVGIGPEGPGVYRQTGPEGGPAKKVELLRKTQGVFEYDGPHQILYGPDGHLYLCLSNFGYAEPYDRHSPHQGWYEGQVLPSWPGNPLLGNRNLRALGGTIVRSTDLTGAHWSLEMGGFRNEYGFALDPEGEIWVFDSDHEFDLSLPWYRPNRILHCPRGSEFGWRTGSGCWPDYYADSLSSVADVGRGCPTGMLFYHHHAYPEKYRGALFMGDWSLGRILVAFPKASGAGFKAAFEVFLTGRPMPVTDLDIGPDGCLYFCTGGGNTEGGLYRVRYVGKAQTIAKRRGEAGLHPAIARALNQPQPESAWGLAQIARAKSEAGTRWGSELTALVEDRARESPLRQRALVLMQQFGPAPTERLLLTLAEDASPRLRAAAIRVLGDLPSARSKAMLVKRMNDVDPVVRRRSLESLLRQGGAVPPEPLLSLCGDEDRSIRYLAHAVLSRQEAQLIRPLVLAEKSPRAAVYGMMALARGVRSPADVEPLLKKQVELIRAAKLSPDLLVELTRAAALTLLVHDGALNALHQEPRPRAATPLPPAGLDLGTQLLALFPNPDWRANREIARLCCRLETPGIQAKILAALKQGASREQQIHYGFCLSAVKGGWTDALRREFLDWFCETQQWEGGSNMHGYLDTFFDGWLKSMPAAQASRFRKEHLARKPKQVERSPLRPAKSKYGFPQITSFLESHPGDAKRGLAVLRKARCLSCHRFGTEGEAFAPDLTTVGQRFKRSEILESILDPSKVIADQYRGITYVLSDGRVLTGMPIAQKETEVTIVLPDTRKITIKKEKIESTQAATQSVMPEGLLNDCSLEEIADLFAILESGPTTGR